MHTGRHGQQTRGWMRDAAVKPLNVRLTGRWRPCPQCWHLAQDGDPHNALCLQCSHRGYQVEFVMGG